MNVQKILVAVGLFFLLAVSAISVVLAGEPNQSEPYGARFIDTELHVLDPHGTTWYHFDFVVDGPGFMCRFVPCPDRAVYHGSATLLAEGMAESGLTFEIYAPAQVSRWREVDPVGRSNKDNHDLRWSGESDSNGSWYVRVLNPMDYPISYRFSLSGVRIALSRAVEPSPTPWSVSRAVERARRPTPTSTPAGTSSEDNIMPSRAARLSAAPVAISQSSDRWFIVGFPHPDDAITLRLVDGSTLGLSFEMYMPTQADTWWKDDPLGRGEPSGADLIWSGAPDGVDTRLVRVLNRSNRDAIFRFLVESPRQPGMTVPPFGKAP